MGEEKAFIVDDTYGPFIPFDSIVCMQSRRTSLAQALLVLGPSLAR